MKAFKAYDIRGVWGEDLNQDIVYQIGFFFSKVIPCNKILIGRDGRISSDDMLKALTDGLTDAGVDVYDAGLSTTPMIYWGTGKFDFDASIMITASHNAANYNGLKFSSKNVQPVGYDNGLNIIELLIEKDIKIKKSNNKGLVKEFRLKEHYLQFLKTYVSDFSGIKMAIDCSNGVASLFVHDLFGREIIYLNDSIDGTFPAHEPNPLLPENQEQIKKTVKQENCDIGLIFDGDADRVMFIDEKGQFISPDLIIAVLGHYFFEERKETGKVVQDIRTSKAVADYLRQFNVDVVTWKVGRAFGATKLKDVDGIYGGELAGHYYFKDFYYSDSGMLAALLVLRVLLKFRDKGINLSQLIGQISTYANTGEVNFKIEQKAEAMEAVKSWFMENESPISFLDVDGYRLDFEDWWFNIRPSNTEPYLRFLAEAKDQHLLDMKTKIIFDIIGKFS